MVTRADLEALLNSLQSGVRVQRVDHEGLNVITLELILLWYEISSVYGSVIDHCDAARVFMVGEGVLCYTPHSTYPFMSPNDVDSLQSFVDRFSIKELILSGCRFGKEVIIGLRDLIIANSTLTAVDFSHCNVSHADISIMFGDLKLNPCLKLNMINLKNNMIRTEGAIALFEVLKTNSTISVICLQSNSIGNDGAIALAEALKINSTVREINLRNNPVDDQTQLSTSKISCDRIRWFFW
ncbi:hypothetical protein GEMRC1_003344 [Eukaryota sp. GEM-RC1]